MTPDRDTIIIQQDPIDDAQVADIKSEYPAGLRSESLAGFELECMADFIGIRRARQDLYDLITFREVERLIQLQRDAGGFQFALDTSSGNNI